MKEFKSHILSAIILFGLTAGSVYGQQPFYFHGKVIDSRSSEPLSYATITLKYNQLGVFTNAEGDFRVPDNPGFKSDSIIVSCIGYHRVAKAIKDLDRTAINYIKVTPYTYSLNEVKVSSKRRRLNSEAIVSRAIREIIHNCPDKPLSYVSYYRDYQKDSSGYLNLNEAIVQTLDTGITRESALNRFRLLDFRKNTDFRRVKVSPFYDLPETDHSDESFKKIPYAVLGDQFGNELFILLAHDAVRNFNKRSFSFVDTLSKDFIDNHIFSAPVGTREGNTLLYRIAFVAKRQITGTVVTMKGNIYIEPNNYSIHKIEYYGSYLDPKKKWKEIFNIEIGYGHEQSAGSKMCLRYISLNNSFTIPDSTDNNVFRMVKSEWAKAGGPYTRLWYQREPNMTIEVMFNRRVDSVSAMREENYNITLGERKAKIISIQPGHDTLFITLKDEKFSSKEISTTMLNIKGLKDINGRLLNKRDEIGLRQFRELFVQQYNGPVEFSNDCFIEPKPLEQNCISRSVNTSRFWMNTPLKTSIINAENPSQDK